jgi:ribonuclease HI
MISVYADGSSTGRSNEPGGWAYVILKDGFEVLSDYGGSPSATNNTMELSGAIEGLKALINSGLAGPEDKVELVCDSRYVLGLASGEYKPKKNVALACEVRRLYIKAKATTRWVRGHEGNTYNERCDVLAKRGKEENTL